MATEEDKTSTGALMTLVAVGTFVMIAISLAVTAITREEVDRATAEKEAPGANAYKALHGEQLAQLAASGKPIEQAKQEVLAALQRDPNSATPAGTAVAVPTPAASGSAAPAAPDASAAPSPAPEAAPGTPAPAPSGAPAPAPNAPTGAVQPKSPAAPAAPKPAPAAPAAPKAAPAAPAPAAPAPAAPKPAAPAAPAAPKPAPAAPTPAPAPHG